jgi:hypothetical protein
MPAHVVMAKPLVPLPPGNSSRDHPCGSRPPEPLFPPSSSSAAPEDSGADEPPPKKKKKSKKSDKGKPSPKPATPSGGPSSFKDLLDLPPPKRVGAWSAGLKLNASVFQMRRKGQDVKYSVEKLRGALGPKACLPTHCADLAKLKYVRCLNPNEPGHEPEGSAHEVNPQFNAKWNHPVTGEAFRATFEV